MLLHYDPLWDLYFHINAEDAAGSLRLLHSVSWWPAPDLSGCITLMSDILQNTTLQCWSSVLSQHAHSISTSVIETPTEVTTGTSCYID